MSYLKETCPECETAMLVKDHVMPRHLQAGIDCLGSGDTSLEGRANEVIPDTPEVTKQEAKAIADLAKLASRWPKSLMLFSQSGSLIVLKLPEGAEPTLRYEVAKIHGIRNDGGDADF